MPSTTLPLLLLLLLIPAAVSSVLSPSCLQTCGSATVPYPFGFSPACPIPLTCSASSEIRVGEFAVRNLTSSSLLVDVPVSCNRSLRAAAAALFGPNFALTSHTGLFLRGCAAQPAASACAVPAPLLSPRPDCGGEAENVTCYPSAPPASAGFLGKEDVDAAGCGLLFTAVAYESVEGQPSLVLGTAEVGWWLEGTCTGCSGGANCTNLTSPATQGPAFRCSCLDGYVGDGFADGAGCRKVAAPRCVGSTFMSGSCGGDPNKAAVLIGGVIVGAAAMAVISLACYLISRRSSTTLRKLQCTRRLLSQASCTVPLYSYREIERATDRFSDAQRIGTGAYGTVYAGRLGNHRLVAIKKIRHRDADGTDQVMNEIKLLSSVSHPNLVRLLGCCIERDEQILVYEFMPNGTLAQHLQRERGPAPLPWTVRLAIAAGTARAVAYLHCAVHPPIYHRDIKSSNILLDYNYNSKVADFGLSRMGMVTESSHISTAPQGTPGYVDPQYHQNFHLSDKSDVYSFGVVLVEIISALKVVDFSRVPEEVNLAALAVDKIGKGRVDEIIDPFLEPHRDAWTLTSIHKVAELAFRCLAFHSDMRPTMAEVADELEEVRLSGWAPAEDNVFMSMASSLCTSPSNVTDKSRAGCSSKSTRAALVTSSAVEEEEEEVESPVSVDDRWCSERSSSPLANS